MQLQFNLIWCIFFPETTVSLHSSTLKLFCLLGGFAYLTQLIHSCCSGIELWGSEGGSGNGNEREQQFCSADARDGIKQKGQWVTNKSVWLQPTDTDQTGHYNNYYHYCYKDDNHFYLFNIRYFYCE